MSDPCARTLEEENRRLAEQFIAAFRANPEGDGWIDILKVAFDTRCEAQRERDARIAEDLLGWSGPSIAAAIRGGADAEE